MNFNKHLLISSSKIKSALKLLSSVGLDTTLFAVNKNNKLIGSISDGDIRRGLLRGISLDDPITEIINKKPKFIRKGNYSIGEIKKLRKNNYKLVPVIDNDDVIVNVISFRSISSYLPIDVVIMAGGLGSRLKPLTDKIPKPLLKIGDKSIIDHNIDRLISFGIDDFWISIGYLANKIKNHLGNGKNRNIKIDYVIEKNPLGTIGAVSKINNFKHDYILVTNSDILTNLNYENFFVDFIKKRRLKVRFLRMQCQTLGYQVFLQEVKSALRLYLCKIWIASSEIRLQYKDLLLCTVYSSFQAL